MSASDPAVLPFADPFAPAWIRAHAERGDGSCMIVVATDAPVLSRNLKRMARRAVLGLGRTGSFLSNGSGDFVVAFRELVEDRLQ